MGSQHRLGFLPGGAAENVANLRQRANTDFLSGGEARQAGQTLGIFGGIAGGMIGSKGPRRPKFLPGGDHGRTADSA